jgi:hypothetical protein
MFCILHATRREKNNKRKEKPSVGLPQNAVLIIAQYY